MDIGRSFGLDALVERRIQTAMARGQFDNLPGAGRPLAFDDDPLVPEELRVAFRLLKNAGFVPPELEKISQVNQLVGVISRGGLAQDERTAASRRMRALLIELELAGRNATAQVAWQQYGEALRTRCERSPDGANCRNSA